MKKDQIFFLSERFPYLVVKFSIYLHRRVFVMSIAKPRLIDKMLTRLFDTSSIFSCSVFGNFRE